MCKTSMRQAGQHQDIKTLILSCAAIHHASFDKDGSSNDAWCIAAQERMSVFMSWCCPACRIEVLHIATHQLPDPSKSYRCQACRLNLRFSWVFGKMKIASFQPDTKVQARVVRSRVSAGMRVKRTK